jgi:hypothetical protein
MAKTRQEAVYETLYKMGFNQKDSKYLSRRIVQNLDNYANVQELMMKRRNDEAMQRESRNVVPSVASGRAYRASPTQNRRTG